MATTTYEPIQSYTLSSSQATITFSSIPQTYTDLIVVISAKSASSGQYLRCQVGNGSADTGSNYSSTQLAGNGSSAYSYRYSNNTNLYFAVDSTTSTTINNPYFAHIQNYSNTTTNKTILFRGNQTTSSVEIAVGLWRNTAAINVVKIFVDSDSFATGSTFTLYGIANADIGAKATGGVITYDSTYYYHTFGASGTFTPKQNLTVDYLVVAGGGGGGNNVGGGGGAGGLRSSVTATGGGGSLETPLSLTATGYTVTVGAGGAVGNNGGNSIFSTITSVGGGYGANAGSIGATGGSGGGTGGAQGGATAGGTASPAGQGFAGGNVSSSNTGGTGGGGAGSTGSTATTNDGSNGGNGVAIPSIANITGTGVTTFYAGGGGGGVFASTVGGTATAGGGNGAGSGGPSTANSGIVNTGGGGGGGRWVNYGTGNGGAGGSGIVIVRYAK